MTQTPRPRELWHFTALVDVIDDVAQFFFVFFFGEFQILFKVFACTLDLINVVKKITLVDILIR